ncbi:hypothetical protein P2H44_12040 [Albimonas sp. CAU 1670]|uniref:hypothetical protein n=1 Tax=Albimonas sp. CAU 1670 TaxID=3032599 RepID=UPI0023DA64DF|nr:hypothetical protein [Albimonas sp. CAU 1670]MDF2233283.1 hypothetical protein [Albimonas sp. CAU 1670]
MSQYHAMTREEYAEHMARRLAKWEDDINHLRDRTEAHDNAEVKAEWKAHLAELEHHHAAARARYDRAARDDTGAQDEIRRGFERAGDEIARIWSRVAAKL